MLPSSIFAGSCVASTVHTLHLILKIWYNACKEAEQSPDEVEVVEVEHHRSLEQFSLPGEVVMVCVINLVMAWVWKGLARQ